MLGTNRFGRITWLSRAFAGECGASTVEYALIVAMIPLVALAGIDLLGVNVARPFHQISANLEGNGSSGADAKNISAQRQTATVSEPFDWTKVRLSFLVLSVGTLIGGIVIMRRRSVREQLMGMTSDDVLTAEVQTQRFAAKRQRILRQLSHDMNAVLCNQIRIEQVMTADPVTVLPGTPVDEVAKRMLELRTRHLLVCDKNNELVGVISDRDVLSRNGRRAGDIMSHVVAPVAPDAFLSHAVTAMLSRQISSLAVVDNGRLRGIITTTDVLMTLQCALQLVSRGEEPEAEAATTISELCGTTE